MYIFVQRIFKYERADLIEEGGDISRHLFFACSRPGDALGQALELLHHGPVQLGLAVLCCQ